MDWDTSLVPDPQDPATFAASKLDWSELEQPQHAELLELATQLLRSGATYPDFTDPRFDQGRALSDDDEGWLLLERGDMIMVVNFADEPTEVWVGRGLEALLILGEVEIRGETVHLGRQSAVAAQALA